MISSEERDLAIKFSNGSQSAFARIFGLYHKRIYNFCLRLLNNKDDAVEIVQKVFVALWEQRNNVDYEKPLAIYIFSIARYMVYQEFRNKIYRKAAFEEVTGGIEISHENAIDEVLFKELCEILQKLIDKLPPRQKEIFSLSRDSGLTYKQIAAKLGITENTVDTQMRRALEYMRKEFDRIYR